MRGLAVLAVTCGALFAQTEGTAKAEALVKDAIAFAKKNGKAKLLEATSLPAGQFHLKKGDSLYLFIYDLNGLCIAHGSRAPLVGLNRFDAKDPDGKFYVREMIANAKGKGRGWTDYKYPDPKTGKVEPKSTFVMLHEDMVICAGAYTE
jgi:signal transduction histidine kinase